LTHCRDRIAGRPSRRLAAAAGAIALAAGGTATAQTTPGEVVTGAYGDWLTRCFADAPQPDCALTQYVVAEDRPGANLNVAVWRGLPEGDALQVIAPLGVALRLGVTMWIDQDALGASAEAVRVGTIAFESCGTDGCLAQVLLDATTLGLLRSGATAVFVFTMSAAPDEAVGIPISLAGFGAGFDALAD